MPILNGWRFVCSTLRTIFAQFGLPARIVTDNVRNFTSAEFDAFLHKNGIKHMTSSPYHPSSNGLAERAVQSFKQAKSGSVLDKISCVLFHSHMTPNTATGILPAELLQNRTLRSRLDLLRPDMEARVLDKLSKQEHYANRHSKIRPFQEGEEVYIHNFGEGQKWIPGRIIALEGNVSFRVQFSDGRMFVRHVDHIWKRVVRLSDPIPRFPEPVSEPLPMLNDNKAVTQSPSEWGNSLDCLLSTSTPRPQLTSDSLPSTPVPRPQPTSDSLPSTTTPPRYPQQPLLLVTHNGYVIHRIVLLRREKCDELNSTEFCN